MLKQETFINACLGLCLLSSVSLAGAAVEESVEIEFPDLELLEFLGQFATDDGNWLEPNSLLSDEFGQLLDAATENDAETENYSEPHSERTIYNLMNTKLLSQLFLSLSLFAGGAAYGQEKYPEQIYRLKNGEFCNRWNYDGKACRPNDK